MSSTYITRQGDMVDAIARIAYGTEHNGNTEALLAANPGLADLGPTLPEGLTILLPVLPTTAAPATIATVDLWS